MPHHTHAGFFVVCLNNATISTVTTPALRNKTFHICTTERCCRTLYVPFRIQPPTPSPIPGPGLDPLSPGDSRSWLEQNLPKPGSQTASQPWTSKGQGFQVISRCCAPASLQLAFVVCGSKRIEPNVLTLEQSRSLAGFPKLLQPHTTTYAQTSHPVLLVSAAQTESPKPIFTKGAQFWCPGLGHPLGQHSLPPCYVNPVFGNVWVKACSQSRLRCQQHAQKHGMGMSYMQAVLPAHSCSCSV